MKLKDADEGRWFAGVQVRSHLTSALAVEGPVDYCQQIYKIETVFPVHDTDTSVVMSPVQVSLIAYLMRESSLSPYLFGGRGWYYTRVETEAIGYDENINRFGAHAGVGLEGKLNEQLSIDTSYHYVWLEDFESRDESLDDKNYEQTGSMITIALNFLF